MTDIDDIWDDDEDRSAYAKREVDEPPTTNPAKPTKPVAKIGPQEIAEMRVRYLVEPTPLGRPRLTDPVRADMTRLLDALEAVRTDRDEAVQERDMLRAVVERGGATIEQIQDRIGDLALDGTRGVLVAAVRAVGGDLFIPYSVVAKMHPKDAILLKSDVKRNGWALRYLAAGQPIPRPLCHPGPS